VAEKYNACPSVVVKKIKPFALAALRCRRQATFTVKKIGKGDDLNWQRYLAGSLLDEIGKEDDLYRHRYLAGSLLDKIGKGD
jgi:hypothetical protein